MALPDNLQVPRAILGRMPRFSSAPLRGAQVFSQPVVERCAHLSLRIKFLFLLWIIIRGSFDAAVSATAAWCILYSFTKVLWPECFWVCLAIHFIWDLSLVKYVRTHTSQDCFIYLRLDSISVVLSTFF